MQMAIDELRLERDELQMSITECQTSALNLSEQSAHNQPQATQDRLTALQPTVADLEAECRAEKQRGTELLVRILYFVALCPVRTNVRARMLAAMRRGRGRQVGKEGNMEAHRQRQCALVLGAVAAIWWGLYYS